MSKDMKKSESKNRKNWFKKTYTESYIAKNGLRQKKTGEAGLTCVLYTHSHTDRIILT